METWKPGNLASARAKQVKQVLFLATSPQGKSRRIPATSDGLEAWFPSPRRGIPKKTEGQKPWECGFSLHEMHPLTLHMCYGSLTALHPLTIPA